MTPDFYSGRHVLVTGGAGFIGSHLAEALVDLGATVRILDDLSGGFESNLDSFRHRAGGRLRFVVASILDGDTLHREMSGCDVVFHQAALGSVPRSLEQPQRYYDVNVTGTAMVLETARQLGVRRVVFASSSSVYGDSPTLPKSESMPVMPKSPYAATKAADEALVRGYASSYPLDAVSLRYFNIFGPRQNANSAYAAVIAAFATAMLAGRPPVIFGDGEQSRDFTYVANAVHANLLAASTPRRLNGAVLNVACGDRITVNQLAQAMAQCGDQPPPPPEYADQRPGDVRHSLADLTQCRQLIGYQPTVDFHSGLKKTVEWYRQEAAVEVE